MKMGRYKFKNYILFSLIFLSQIHILFRGCGFKFVWLLNNVSKTMSFSTFLFVKHVSSFVLIYCLLKPKGVNKNLVLFFLVITFLDIMHFLLLSGFDFEYYKIGLSGVIFLFIKYKKCIKF